MLTDIRLVLLGRCVSYSRDSSIVRRTPRNRPEMYNYGKTFCVFLFYLVFVVAVDVRSTTVKLPTVLISVLARNKAHTLPYFLSALEKLNYPKERIALRIRSDHNIDNTIEILQIWMASVQHQYHSIDSEFIDDDSYVDEQGPNDWSKLRYENVISLRESALEHARNVWADYLLTLDCDVFLTNPDTLHHLISKNLTVVAPMLKSSGLYSNFWFGMTEEYYYQRTEDYKPVVYREKLGCFEAPMVHTAVLIDLRKTESDFLTYVPGKLERYSGPHDDIIAFAVSANQSNVSLVVCNEEIFGFVMIPLEQDDTVSFDLLQLTNLKLEVLSEREKLYVSEDFVQYTSLPEKDTLGFDRIFMINLLRRPERRRRMMECFDELGLEVVTLDAVDGRALNDSALEKIKFLPDYADPYHKRAMTLGEIGCFLSHYNVWKEVVEKEYDSILVLEDDIRFEPFFRLKVQNLMQEVHQLGDWDLVYFGRKRLQENEEPFLPGSNYLVEAGYSYWTLGYILSYRGARKLVDADPLSKLVPVDEYLPMLFDKHPHNEWKRHFPVRNLKAYSAAPLLLYPTHYTGEKGYISDTEDSIIAKEILPRDDL